MVKEVVRKLLNMNKYLLLAIAMTMVIAGCKQEPATLEFGNTTTAKKVLIAGDTSEFKQKVLDRLVQNLGTANYYIKCISLDDMRQEDQNVYGAIVLVNTLRAGRMDQRVKNVLRDDPANKKLIIFTTHGFEGDWQPKVQVDTVTSASMPDQVGKRADELAGFITKRF
jgi:hypothetical protein